MQARLVSDGQSSPIFWNNSDVGLFVRSLREIRRNPVNDLDLLDVTLVCEVHNSVGCSFADRIVGPGGTLEINARVG